MTQTLIGQKLRACRRECGMTQENLAEKAGLHPTYIGQVERGEKNLTVSTLEKLLDAMGLSLADFFAFLPRQKSAADYPARCYELLLNCTLQQQKQLYALLQDVLAMLP